MAIHNGIGITSYSRYQKSWVKGAPAGEIRLARPAINPLTQQVWEITVGGSAADGVYSFTVQELDGTEHVVSFTRGSGESNDEISDGLLATAQALASLTGVAIAADSDTNDLQLTFDSAGIDYVIKDLTAPAGASLTSTEITDPAGTAIPIGRFVVNDGSAADGGRKIALPDGAAVADLIGFVPRPVGSFPNDGSSLQSAVDTVPAGRVCDVVEDGDVAAENVGGAASADGTVYVVISTAGGDELGEVRGDADGVAGLFTVTPVAAETSYRLKITFRGETHYVVADGADGSYSVGEIIDDLVASAGGQSALSDLTFTDNATNLTIAGVSGEDLSVEDVGDGDAGVVETTAPAPYTVALPKSQARWLEDVAAGATGPLYFRR